MVGYRCYIIDAEDHIVQAHDLDCGTDAEAASTAEDFLAQDPYHRAVEVWTATRRVAKLDRDPVRHRRPTRREPPSARTLGSAA
jgi:hypothetical protein